MVFKFRVVKWKNGSLRIALFFLSLSFTLQAQQIKWTRLYPLAKDDYIYNIVKDTEGYMYAGGSTERNRIHVGGGTYYNKAMLIKMDTLGDTVFVKDLGIPGNVYSMTLDPWGNIRANITNLYTYYTIMVSMTTDGFIFDRDTIKVTTVPYHCTIGKDSSLIVVGLKDRAGFPGDVSMFFQRVQKDGIVDPLIELNPGHPDCVANRVEQLPNGHYLVSGYVGSRIASYELDEFGLNPVFKQWYQTPDLSNMTTGYVSRINGQRYMIGGQGNPSRVGNVDSLKAKYWLRSDNGVQVPPQAMTDGSTVFGYKTGPPSYQTMYRLGPDSSTIWNMALKDSLVERGMNRFVQIKSFAYFEDQSAVLAGWYYLNGTTSYDPFFMKVANVGTPVTSLIKPKKGPLANESLAPWPNPTSGTLYLKQHFDRAEIHIYTIAGKEVGSYSIGFAQPIDISGYEAGIYLYRAVIDGKCYSGKIVKN